MKKYLLFIFLILFLALFFLLKTNFYKQYELKNWASSIQKRGHAGRSCFRGSGDKKVKYPKDYNYKKNSGCLNNIKLKLIRTDEIKTMGIYRGTTDYGISCELTLSIYYNGWDDWCEVAWFYTHDNIPLGEATSLRAP